MYRIGTKGTGLVKGHFLGRWLRGYGRYMKYKEYLKTITGDEIVQERLRIINYFDEFGPKATRQAFGFGRSTIYLWKKTYADSRSNAASLIPKSRRPKRVRQMILDGRVVSFLRNIRENNYRLGKEKIKPLLDLYCLEAGIKSISTSLIGKIIKRKNLFFKRSGRIYHDPGRIRPQPQTKRERIPKGYKSLTAGQLLQLDTIVRFDLGTKRYLMTAIDLFSRFSFALAYRKLSSQVALDFFKKLEAVTPFKIQAVKTDNGLEFLKDFDDYLRQKGIFHYFSYPRTPKSNAFIERFNRTIQEEFVEENTEYIEDTPTFNEKLIDYLLYYNQVRPHKSLELKSPLQYLVCEQVLSRMSVTHTNS